MGEGWWVGRTTGFRSIQYKCFMRVISSAAVVFQLQSIPRRLTRARADPPHWVVSDVTGYRAAPPAVAKTRHQYWRPRWRRPCLAAGWYDAANQPPLAEHSVCLSVCLPVGSCVGFRRAATLSTYNFFYSSRIFSLVYDLPYLVC